MGGTIKICKHAQIYEYDQFWGHARDFWSFLGGPKMSVLPSLPRQMALLLVVGPLNKVCEHDGRTKGTSPPPAGGP